MVESKDEKRDSQDNSLLTRLPNVLFAKTIENLTSEEVQRLRLVSHPVQEVTERELKEQEGRIWRPRIQNLLQGPFRHNNRVANILSENFELPLQAIYEHLVAYQRLNRKEKAKFESATGELFARFFTGGHLNIELEMQPDWATGQLWYKYLKNAARIGNLSLVKWLSRRVYVDQDVVHAAALSGNPFVVEFLQGEGNVATLNPLLPDAVDVASRRRKRFYDISFMAFYIALVAVIIANVSAIWPALLTLMIGLIMTLKKAHHERSKFALGVLIGFYGLGGIIALIVASVTGAVLMTLAYWVGVLAIVGAVWCFYVVCSSSREGRQEALIVVMLILIGGVLSFLSTNLVVAAIDGPIFAAALGVLIVLLVLLVISSSTSPSRVFVRRDWLASQGQPLQQAPQGVLVPALELAPLNVPTIARMPQQHEVPQLREFKADADDVASVSVLRSLSLFPHQQYSSPIVGAPNEDEVEVRIHSDRQPPIVC